MKTSKIGWTDYSGGDLNFVIGCTPVSEACENCYAAAWARRAGRDFGKVQLFPEKLERLLTATFPTYSPKRGAEGNPMAFVVDLGDLFHPLVPADFIIQAFEIMGARSDVEWQVLTKRPERAADVLFGAEGGGYLGGGDYLPNVRMMVTVENERHTDRINSLLDWWRGPNGVSVEPMLGPVNLTPWLWGKGDRLDWVICGGESGPNHRQMDWLWANTLMLQCRGSRVPFFGKQQSGRFPGEPLRFNGREIKQWP